MATQVPSFTLAFSLLNVRRAPNTCHWREAVPLGGDAVHSRRQWGHQVGVREVRNEGDLQGWMVTPLSADQGEGPSANGEEDQVGVPNPL